MDSAATICTWCRQSGHTRDDCPQLREANEAVERVKTRDAACVCGEINTRHCPLHGQGDEAASGHPPVVPDPEQGCDACGEPMTNCDADGQWCDKHGKPPAATNRGSA